MLQDISVVGLVEGLGSIRMVGNILNTVNKSIYLSNYQTIRLSDYQTIELTQIYNTLARRGQNNNNNGG